MNNQATSKNYSEYLDNIIILATMDPGFYSEEKLCETRFEQTIIV